MALDVGKLRKMAPPKAMPFKIRRLGHVVLMVSDLERSLAFYTQVLGFKLSDVYPEEMQPGGFAFLRCGADHHAIALVGAGPGASKHAELHHIAFEVASLEEVFRVRDRLIAHQVEIYWGLDQIGTDGRVRPASEWKGVRGLEKAVADPVVGQDTGVKRGS